MTPLLPRTVTPSRQRMVGMALPDCSTENPFHGFGNRPQGAPRCLTWHPILAELLFWVRSWGSVRLPCRRTPVFKVMWGGTWGSPDRVSLWREEHGRWGARIQLLHPGAPPCPRCGWAGTWTYLFFLCLCRPASRGIAGPSPGSGHAPWRHYT